MKDKTIVLIFGVVFFLAFLKLVLANSLSVTGHNLFQLRQEIIDFSTKNDILKGDISRFESLLRISSEAKNSGFEKPTFVLNMTSEIPVALK